MTEKSGSIGPPASIRPDALAQRESVTSWICVPPRTTVTDVASFFANPRAPADTEYDPSGTHSIVYDPRLSVLTIASGRSRAAARPDSVSRMR